MAENKRSFILYSDIHHTVKKLTDEQAGKLFKHILSYVNDENPIIDDIVLDIAFEPIKQSLKRDLRKYETIREKRSIAGKASADKRQQVLTSVEQKQQVSTHSTVNVNDSVSVNVNDNVSDSVNVIKKEKKYNNIPPSLFEVQERMSKRNINSFTAEKFIAHYTANGWMIGKTKMKNWDAALTTWKVYNEKPNRNEPRRITIEDFK